VLCGQRQGQFEVVLPTVTDIHQTAFSNFGMSVSWFGPSSVLQLGELHKFTKATGQLHELVVIIPRIHGIIPLILGIIQRFLCPICRIRIAHVSMKRAH
jgi:hypothetical protein